MTKREIIIMKNQKREDRNPNQDPGIEIKKNISTNGMIAIEIEIGDKDTKTMAIVTAAEMGQDREEEVPVMIERVAGTEIESTKSQKKIPTSKKEEKLRESG